MDVKLRLDSSLLFLTGSLTPSSYSPPWNVRISHDKSRLLIDFNLINKVCVNGLHSNDLKLKFCFHLSNRQSYHQEIFTKPGATNSSVSAWGPVGSASLMPPQQEAIAVIMARLVIPLYRTWNHGLSSTAGKIRVISVQNPLGGSKYRESKGSHVGICQQRLSGSTDVESGWEVSAGSMFQGHCLDDYKVLSIFHW